MSDEPRSAAELKGKRGLRRLLDAARHSLDGLRAAWQHELSFRLEALFGAVFVAVALVLPVTLVEKLLLVGVVLIVLIVELLNTAVEVAIDRDSLRIDALAKRAKDYGSAAVMMALVLAGATWAAILLDRFVL